MKTIKKTLFDLGTLICLASAALMFDGAALGKTTNAAIMLGVTGVCLIASQRRSINSRGE
jgi:hypothetical protein